MNIVPHGLHVLDITMTAIFACTNSSTVAPEGSVPGDVTQPKRYMIFFFAMKPLYIGNGQNNNDSYFLLYIVPDSNLKVHS